MVRYFWRLFVFHWVYSLVKYSCWYICLPPHKKWSFPLRISSLMENFIFWTVYSLIAKMSDSLLIKHLGQQGTPCSMISYPISNYSLEETGRKYEMHICYLPEVSLWPLSLNREKSWTRESRWSKLVFHAISKLFGMTRLC